MDFHPTEIRCDQPSMREQDLQVPEDDVQITKSDETLAGWLSRLVETQLLP